MEVYVRNSNVPALVDNIDYDYINQFKWVYLQGYAITKINNKTIRMHRLVLQREGYNIDNIYCDHINHNRLDNRRENLRPATPVQNTWNRVNKSNSVVPYKGVNMDKERFRAQIQIPNGKRKFLGNYDTAEQAAYQYNSAAHALFGEYATLNELPIVTNTKTGQVVTGRIYKDDYTMYEPNITSKYYGVGYRKNSGRWRARIRRDGHDIILGEYHNEMDAANAVDNYLVNVLHEEPRNFK